MMQSRPILLAILAAALTVTGCRRGCDGSSTPRDKRLLYKAVVGNEPDLLRELLARGVDSNEKFDDGSTPLIEAVWAGHLKIVRVLLHDGADPNLKGGYLQGAPLHYADSAKVAAALIEAGAKLDDRAEGARTPLHHAAQIGNVPVCRILLDKGAATTINVADSYGGTPLHAAAHAGNKALMNLFFEYGAKLPSPLLDATARGDESRAIDLMKKNSQLVREKDSSAWSVLHWAAALERTRVAEAALASGAEPDLQTSYGWSPLQYACLRGNVQIARMLLEKGAKLDPNDAASAAFLNDGATSGNVDIVKLLLDQGVPAEDASCPGRTVYSAVKGGSAEILELLLAKGVDVDGRGRAGVTALHEAVALGRKDLVILLLKYGADVRVTDQEGKTPIHIAEEKGNEAIVELLRRRQSGSDRSSPASSSSARQGSP